MSFAGLLISENKF